MTNSKSNNTLDEDTIILLIDSLGSGDKAKIEQALLTLGASQNSALFSKVGALARTLHESLMDFQKNITVGGTDMSSTTLPDAAGKLEAVIDMTFEAAHKTLSIAEKQEELVQEGRGRLDALERQIQSGAIGSDKGLDVLLTFCASERERMDQALAAYGEIVNVQSFQDLSGQVLRKVICLITELEKNLVGLVQLFGVGAPEDSCASSTESHNEVEDPIEQEEVDSILKSFGF